MIQHPWQQEARHLIDRHREKRTKLFWRWFVLLGNVFLLALAASDLLGWGTT